MEAESEEFVDMDNCGGCDDINLYDAVPADEGAGGLGQRNVFSDGGILQCLWNGSGEFW